MSVKHHMATMQACSKGGMISKVQKSSYPEGSPQEEATESPAFERREDAPAHPGFKGVQKKIEAEGYSPGAAGAILASKTRGASPAAKKANPFLKRVK